MQYLGLTVSSYEGGSYSETKENLKRSATEHKRYGKIHETVELFRYAVMALAAGTSPDRNGESRHFSAILGDWQAKCMWSKTGKWKESQSYCKNMAKEN